MNLTEFLHTVAELPDSATGYLTISLDLVLDPVGKPSAEQALRTAYRVVAENHGAKTFDEYVTTVPEHIADAAAAGARGLFLVTDGETSLELRTPLPFRNDVRIHPSPWLFELERQVYLLGHPLVLADVDREEATILRIADAEVVDEHEIGRSPRYTRMTRGRTVTEGRMGAGPAGGHSRHRVQNSVREHRAAEAREAASIIEQVWEPGDLLVIAGSIDTRHELIDVLPAPLSQALSEHVPESVPTGEHELLAMIANLSERLQLAEADNLTKELLSGGAGEQIVRGRAAVLGALEAGRVARVLLHEDAVANWGTATDIRPRETPWDDADYQAIIHRADSTSATVEYTQLPALLEMHEGVAAITRW